MDSDQTVLKKLKGKEMSDRSPEIDCNHDNAHYNKCPDCGAITCDYCSEYSGKSFHGLKIHVVKQHKHESSAISTDELHQSMDANYHE